MIRFIAFLCPDVEVAVPLFMIMDLAVLGISLLNMSSSATVEFLSLMMTVSCDIFVHPVDQATTLGERFKRLTIDILTLAFRLYLREVFYTSKKRLMLL